MISLSSTAELVSALDHAHDVALTAYTLPSGSVLDALTGAARRGAHVQVRLEGYIYKDDGSVVSANRDAISELQGAGADAALVHDTVDAPDAMLHLKGAVVDGELFLDDRNWPDDGADTIVRDSFPRDAAMVRDAANGTGDAANGFFSARKRDALASEARLLREARAGDEVIVESESFGGRNSAYSAIDDAAKRGAHVRLLVSSRDLQNNPNERAAIAHLQADGVAARACDGDEKFTVVAGERGWLGSSNASAAFNKPDQLDWGLRTDDAKILSHLKVVFDKRWQNAEKI